MMSDTIGWYLGINKIVNAEYCSFITTWALQSGHISRFRSSGTNVVRARELLNAGLEMIDSILRWILNSATCWHRQADKLVSDAQQQLRLDLTHPTNIEQRTAASFLVETVGFAVEFDCTKCLQVIENLKKLAREGSPFRLHGREIPLWFCYCVKQSREAGKPIYTMLRNSDFINEAKMNCRAPTIDWLRMYVGRIDGKLITDNALARAPAYNNPAGCPLDVVGTVAQRKAGFAKIPYGMGAPLNVYSHAAPHPTWTSSCFYPYPQHYTQRSSRQRRNSRPSAPRVARPPQPPRNYQRGRGRGRGRGFYANAARGRGRGYGALGRRGPRGSGYRGRGSGSAQRGANRRNGAAGASYSAAAQHRQPVARSGNPGDDYCLMDCIDVESGGVRDPHCGYDAMADHRYGARASTLEDRYGAQHDSYYSGMLTTQPHSYSAPMIDQEEPPYEPAINDSHMVLQPLPPTSDSAVQPSQPLRHTPTVPSTAAHGRPQQDVRNTTLQLHDLSLKPKQLPKAELVEVRWGPPNCRREDQSPHYDVWNAWFKAQAKRLQLTYGNDLCCRSQLGLWCEKDMDCAFRHVCGFCNVEQHAQGFIGCPVYRRRDSTAPY